MKKIVLIIASTAALIFCIWLVSNWQFSRKAIDVLKQESHPKAAATEALEQQAKFGLNSIHTPYEMTRRDGNSGEKSPFSSSDLLRVIGKFNAPVDFYGKVVDQDGNGIEGVKIYCDTVRIAVLDNGRAESGVYDFSLFSGEGGWFHISGFAASSFYFHSFEKEGYLQPSESSINLHSYSAGRRQNTKENPAIFYLWKTMEGGASIKSRGGAVDFALVNGGFREIVLSYSAGTERKEFGKMSVAVNANLEELANIPYYFRGEKPYDWSATIEILDGGILLTQEVLPYLAPEKGYVKKVYVEMRKDNPHWTNRLELKAYVHNESSGLYSRWEMAIYIGHTKDANGVPQWNMDYTFNVNPDGSRILELNQSQ